MPTSTTKVTDMPGDKPRPLTHAEEFDRRVVERAAIEAKINELVGRYIASRNQT